jgi:hypothetical protein
MKRAKAAKPRTGDKSPVRRNVQKFIDIELRAPTAPEAPIVATPLLRAPPVSFIKFLRDEQCGAYCDLLFGKHDTSAGTMLAELRKAIDFPAFYHGRPGKLSRQARTKKLLKKFARRAYRGDPDRRGVAFWERVAWLIWNASVALTALRARADQAARGSTDRKPVSHPPQARGLYAPLSRQAGFQAACQLSTFRHAGS